MNISDMQLVCDYILKQECSEKQVTVKRTKRKCSSVARYRTKEIIIAQFIFYHPEEIQLAEIIHETCHFITDDKHGANFREKEKHYLAVFGLTPLNYKRAYYRTLKLYSGEIIPTRSLKYEPDKEFIDKIAANKPEAKPKRQKHKWIEL